MIFTAEKLNDLLAGGYDRAVSEDKEAFIAYYAYLFDDSGACADCPRKMRGYWDRLVKEGEDKMQLKKEILKIMAKKENEKVEELVNTEVVEATNVEATNEWAKKEVLKNKIPDKPLLFKLREGISSLSMDFGSSELFNNDTLTNEIAMRYLSINPNRIANFGVYPENWEEYLQ